MLLCIAGKNSIAINALRHSVNLFGLEKIVVCPNPSDEGISRWQPSLRRYAQEIGLRIVTLDQLYQVKDLIFVSLEYEKIIDPKNFISTELFNIHFSKLPSYKGMYTSAWPILNGENESGVTLHKIDQGIDTGEIIDQKDFHISSNETSRSLYFKYLKYGTYIFKKNIGAIVKQRYKSSPQLSSRSSYFPKESINYLNLRINLKNTAETISQQIRAFSFREFQLPIIGTIKVGNHKITNQRSFLRPGTVTAKKNGYILATIDYDILIEEDFGEIFFKWLELSIEERKEFPHKKYHKYVNIKNKNGWSPLMIAAFRGDMNACEKLLSINAKINDANSNGTTPLMYAKEFCIHSSNFELCEFLIKKGANPKQRDFFGRNVLDYAISNNQAKAINFFRKYL